MKNKKTVIIVAVVLVVIIIIIAIAISQRKKREMERQRMAALAASSGTYPAYGMGGTPRWQNIAEGLFQFGSAVAGSKANKDSVGSSKTKCSEYPQYPNPIPALACEKSYEAGFALGGEARGKAMMQDCIKCLQS